MRLTYKILWFEDDDGFYDGLDFDQIYWHLEAKGFRTQIARMKGQEQPAEILSKAQKADLLVMDFTLEEGVTGDNLIRNIRNGSINTEIVFYSAKGAGQLRQSVSDKELDGVFCRGRGEIIQDVIPIIDSTIRKILDLENSRGLVMAEVGEIDRIMQELIKTYHDSSEVASTFVRNKLKEKLDDFCKSLNKGLVEFDNSSIDDILEGFDSYKRVGTVMSICKNIGLNNEKKELKGYEDSVLFRRNCLAHGTPEETEDGFKFTHRGKEFMLNDETNTEIRSNLISFKNTLEIIIEGIKAPKKPY